MPQSNGGTLSDLIREWSKRNDLILDARAFATFHVLVIQQCKQAALGVIKAFADTQQVICETLAEQIKQILALEETPP